MTIPANVRHWHGAGPAGAMTHIAIAEKDDGVSVSWQDKVSDELYQAAVLSAGLAFATPTAPSSGRDAEPKEFERSVTHVIPSSGVLSAKQREIPLISSAMASSDMPRLDAALDHGLDAGMTLSEAKEILIQLYAYAGFPRSLNALGELLKVAEARRQRGIIDAPGREPIRAIPSGDALVAIGRANQTEISGGPVTGAVFDFAPTINRFLQAHLFGDIFERDNLDWQSRELATVGALAATPGAEAQLLSHMRASMRVGLSAGQLRELVQVLEQHGDAGHAARADAALTQAIAAASKG